MKTSQETCTNKIIILLYLSTFLYCIEKERKCNQSSKYRIEIETASLNQGIDGSSLPNRRKCMNENEPRY